MLTAQRESVVRAARKKSPMPVWDRRVVRFTIARFRSATGSSGHWAAHENVFGLRNLISRVVAVRIGIDPVGGGLPNDELFLAALRRVRAEHPHFP